MDPCRHYLCSRLSSHPVRPPPPPGMAVLQTFVAMLAFAFSSMAVCGPVMRPRSPVSSQAYSALQAVWFSVLLKDTSAGGQAGKQELGARVEYFNSRIAISFRGRGGEPSSIQELLLVVLTLRGEESDLHTVGTGASSMSPSFTAQENTAQPSCFCTADFLFFVCPVVASFHNGCLFGVSSEVSSPHPVCVCPPHPHPHPPTRTPQTAHPTPPRSWTAPCSRWSPPLFRRDTSACWATASTFTSPTGSQTTTCWTR